MNDKDIVLVKNASDSKQVKKAKEKEESAKEKELNDVRFILNSFEGRRFVWKLLNNCGVFKTSFTGNSTTFFNEGQRNIGLRLLDDINEAAPEAYAVMLKESKK